MNAPAETDDLERHQALLRHLVDREVPDSTPGDGSSRLVAALSAEGRDVRTLALQLAAESPSVVDIDDLVPLLTDIDVAIRSRSAEVLSAIESPRVVPELARRLMLEADDGTLGVLVQGLARATQINRPLGTDVEAELLSAIETLDEGRRVRHRHALDALDRMLGLARSRPARLDDLEVAEQPRVTRPNTFLRLVGDDSSSPDPMAAIDIVMSELESTLLGPDTPERESALASVGTLRSSDVEAWYRTRLGQVPASQLDRLAAAIIATPDIDLVAELCESALLLTPGNDRERLLSVLAGHARAWDAVASFQQSDRTDFRLRGFHLATALDPSADASVLRALDDPSATVRLAATDAVGRTGTHEVYQRLATLVIDDSSAAVRLGAARGLTRAPADIRSAAARRALRSDDVAIRACAVALLGRGGGAEVALLARSLRDPAVEVSSIAAELLARHHSAEAPALLWQALVELPAPDRSPLFAGLDLLAGDALSTTLHQALESDVADERALGLQIAARSAHGDGFVDVLHAALTDPAVGVRLHALDALAQRLDAVDVARVGERVHDPAPAVRLEAVRLLRSAVDDRSFEPLLAAASDPAEHVRALARRALLERSGTSLVRDLIAVLGSPISRRAVHDLLVELGGAALDAMLEALATADAVVVDAVGEILVAAEHVPELVARLTSRDDRVRSRALDGLHAAGDPRATAAVAERLEDPVPTVRARAVDVLVSLGDPRAVDPLRRALVSDPDLALVSALETALRRLTEKHHGDTVGDLVIDLSSPSPRLA